MSDDEIVIKVDSKIGNLHSKEVYNLYKMAGASFLVLNILASGVPLYFLDLKIRKFPRGKDCNNKSALTQKEFVSETLKEWEQAGFVKEVRLEEAKVILPLSVAHRWSHSKKKLKYRLVLDCSPLTDKLSYGRIKLPDLNYLRNQIRKNDYLGLIDITSFYLHFTLQETFADRLCFQWDFQDGRGLITFQAVVMLFGVPHAPWVVTMCTDVMVKYFRKTHSIMLNPFIDDFSHLCHGTLEEAVRQFNFAKEEIGKWGFIVSEGKLVPPARKNMILGYEIDTIAMVMKFDENKWDEVNFLLVDALQPKVPVRYLARIVGKLFSMGYATKIPVSSFMPLAISTIARATVDGDWRSWNNEIEITQDIYDELLFLLNNIKSWNGVDLKKPFRIHFYDSENPVSHTTFDPYIGDASKEAAAMYSIKNPRKFAIRYFPETLAMASSARRELASIELLIMEHSEWLEKGSTVVYASDNTSVNRWVNVGTCKRDVAKTLQNIFLKCLSLEIDLRVTWVPRSHMLLVEADMLSRRDTDEYTLRNRDMEYIKWQYGSPFTLDVFASQFLFRATKFYSKFPSSMSSGTDGLYQPWAQEDVWMFPPRKLLGHCIQRLFSERSIRGALVALDNTEGLMKTLMFPQGHAPTFVYRVFRFPVKIRMGYKEDISDAMRNTFSDNWHDLIGMQC